MHIFYEKLYGMFLSPQISYEHFRDSHQSTEDLGLVHNQIPAKMWACCDTMEATIVEYSTSVQVTGMFPSIMVYGQTICSTKKGRKHHPPPQPPF